MKLDRLIGILSILLQRERVTAPELAERFEVSRRTIQRDVEALCRAGIPLVTVQGAGGGISILEGYRVDRTVLTGPEMQDILAGLRSLDSVSGTSRYAQLMEKLSAGAGTLVPEGADTLIDLSSWYRTALAPKIEAIRTALREHRTIRFTYHAPKGESEREAEPYYLVFRWSAWYVWAWCRDRGDFRLFKLNRMTGPDPGGALSAPDGPPARPGAGAGLSRRVPGDGPLRPRLQVAAGGGVRGGQLPSWSRTDGCGLPGAFPTGTACCPGCSPSGTGRSF